MNLPARLLALLLLTTVWVGCGSSYKHSTPTELGESVFLALKNNDSQGYASLYPSKSDITEIIEKQEMDPEKRPEFEQKMIENMEKAKAKIAASFQFVRKQMEKDGVDISQAVWKGADVTSRPGKGSLQLSNVVLFFEYDGTQYALQLRDAGKLDRGWFVNMDPLWVGKAN